MSAHKLVFNEPKIPAMVATPRPVVLFFEQKTQLTVNLVHVKLVFQESLRVVTV